MEERVSIRVHAGTLRRREDKNNHSGTSAALRHCVRFDPFFDKVIKSLFCIMMAEPVSEHGGQSFLQALSLFLSQAGHGIEQAVDNVLIGLGLFTESRSLGPRYFTPVLLGLDDQADELHDDIANRQTEWSIHQSGAKDFEQVILIACLDCPQRPISQAAIFRSFLLNEPWAREVV